ncbi:MAG: hypothetical protein ACJ8G7_05540 [Rhizobacter sp.]
MERVAFLIEKTGERIECLLNPETFTITRQSGVRPHRTLSGVLTGAAQSDNPVLAVGGGTTELVVELLFDISKQPNAGPDDSVQTLTAPLWDLAENSDVDVADSGPPLVRFVWGKSWNIPAVVVSVAERFEQFTPAGVPQRSWVKMRLLRSSVSERALDGRPAVKADEAMALVPDDVRVEDLQTHEVAGELAGSADEGMVERIDQLAHRYYGDASLWPVLASFNDLDDPARLPVGASLVVPPLTSSA